MAELLVTIGSNVGFRLNGLIPTPQSGSFPHVCVLACLQAQTDTGLDNYLHVMLDVRISPSKIISI